MQRLAFLVVALGLVACGDDDPVSSTGDETRSEFASRVATKVAGRDWTLAAFAAGGRYTAALADRPITLQLTDDGQVRGSAGCNTYFGTYQVVEAGTISISGLAGTEMACYPESVMAQEAAYLQALAAATGMSLSDGQLRLLQGSGDRFLLFAAAADGAAPGNDTGGDSTAADTTTCESCGQAASGLVGRLWVARYFESGGGAEAVSDGVKITLSFGRDGRASGSAGCNQFSGRYRADDAGHLVLRDIAITEMYCQVPEVMEWENRFTALLGRADGFAVQGERLVLHAGDQALHLSASDEPSDPGGEPEWYEARAAAGEATVAYTVHACTAGDPATRSPEPLVLVADGDDLYFHQVVSTYCNALTARALSVEPVVDGSRITLNFTFRGPAVRCLCAFPVRGVIEGLAAGTYTVTAVYGAELEGGVHLEAEVLSAAEVTVGDPGILPEPVPADLKLTADDAGDTVWLPQPGALVEVALEANPSTGFSWLPASEDGAVLALAGECYDAGAGSAVGASTTQRLYFRVQAPGTAVLRLAYARPWESVPPAATFEVVFVVNGGIVPLPVDPPSYYPLGIRLGSSFGLCQGYCWQEIYLDEEAMILLARSSDEEAFPQKAYREKMDPEVWRRLAELADIGTLERMDEQYGCPDCADGGAEWVGINLSGRIEVVTFEYGASLEPIAVLLAELRALREGLVERAGF